MLEILNRANSVIEALQLVNSGQRILVIADNEYESIWMGQLIMDIANAKGAEATLVAINPSDMKAKEPPAIIAASMKNVDTVIRLSDKAPLIHTNARKEATAVGVRFCILTIDDIKQATSIDDIRLIQKRTETIAQMLSQTKIATVTSPAGTVVSLSLSGRPALSLHPLNRLVGGGSPHYAEAAIAPVEGTANGTIVIDIAMIDWEYLLREPIRLTIQEGNVVNVSGAKKDAEKLREIIFNHENATNIAELGIGTSHTVPLPIRGTRRDAARLGTAHFALGRNNDFGGKTKSDVHLDGLMDQVTVELDGRVVLKDGMLKI